MIFRWFLFMRGSHTWWNLIKKWLAIPERHSLLVFASSLPLAVVCEKSPNDHEILFVCCHVRIHVNFISIVHSLTLLCPSSTMWSELGPTPPFPPTRVLKVQWSRALSLVGDVALMLMNNVRGQNCSHEVAWTVHRRSLTIISMAVCST